MKKITGERDEISQVVDNHISNVIKCSHDADNVIVTSSTIEENITIYVQGSKPELVLR